VAKNVEKDIQKFLSEGFSVKNVAEHFIATRSQYPSDNVNHTQLVQFFFNTGHFKEVLEECRNQLHYDRPVAWNFLFLTLKKFKPDHAEKLIQPFLKGATEKGQLNDLLKLPEADGLPIELSLAKRKYHKQVIDSAQDKKNKLFEKLDFLRQEQIVEEEHKALKEIELFYPDDPRVPGLVNEFKQRWARHKSTKKPLSVFNDDIERLEVPTVGEKKTASLWLEACSKVVDKNPDASYNFAIMFYFSGCYEEALIMGKRTKASKNQAWFVVDILIKTRRFVQALDEIEKLEKQYDEDPETHFNATYLKAIAHWGLHQGAIAMDLMKSILKIRPTYRSAQSLYSKWHGGLE
tara:strand:+ start:154895 stop:155941 length:1047 start_codon:yes stop_codon:yes gene_type:complete